MCRSPKNSGRGRPLCLDIVTVPGDDENNAGGGGSGNGGSGGDLGNRECYLCLREENVHALTQCWYSIISSLPLLL